MANLAVHRISFGYNGNNFGNGNVGFCAKIANWGKSIVIRFRGEKEGGRNSFRLYDPIEVINDWECERVTIWLLFLMMMLLQQAVLSHLQHS